MKYSFQAKLENWAEGMDYCAVPVPSSITKALGTQAAVLVMARVNDSEPFQVSLFPAGGGQHYIRIKASVRKETKTKTGDRVRIRFTVLDRADVTIPKDLAAALRAERVTNDFNALPPGKQNFILRRIDDAAKPETRKKRIQEAVVEAHRGRERKTIRAVHWKRPSTMDAEKYNAVSGAILKSLGTQGMRYLELTDRVYPKIKNFEGSLWHYILRCLRELETQGKVVRDLGPPVLYSKKAKPRSK